MEEKREEMQGQEEKKEQSEDSLGVAHLEYVLLSLLLGLSVSDARRSRKPKDLRDGLGLLLLLLQQQVTVLLLQVAGHDVVVNTSFLRVMALIYHYKGDIYESEKSNSTSVTSFTGLISIQY